jgi:hypothetical protein
MDEMGSTRMSLGIQSIQEMQPTPNLNIRAYMKEIIETVFEKFKLKLGKIVSLNPT